MLIRNILNKKNVSVSFEFFPPKTQKASSMLFETIQNLTPLHPAFVSITYGAGGTTRELTNELVLKLHEKTNLTIVPHLTCINTSFKEIDGILDSYNSTGIENIMALRGDPPKDASYHSLNNDFEYAENLVAYIKKKYPQMCIGVAGFPEGHPECPNRLQEIEYLKAKVDAGADYICTQLFFENRDYYDYNERCKLAGINIPIIAGIMPISSGKNLKKISELAQGSRFPAKLLKSILRATDQANVKDVGIHWATEQVRDLLDNEIPGIHFYTLNKYKSTVQICKSLGISSLDNLSNNKTLSKDL